MGVICFYLVTEGWIFYINLLCEKSINQSIMLLSKSLLQISHDVQDDFLKIVHVLWSMR